MTRKATKKVPAKIADQPKKKRIPSEKELATRFKPNNNANPLGSAAHDPFKRELKKLTMLELSEIVQLIMRSTLKELARKIKDEELPALHAVYVRAVLDAAEDGNVEKVNLILERVFGKTAQVIHIESPDGSMSPSRSNLSEEELKAAINKKLDEIEASKS